MNHNNKRSATDDINSQPMKKNAVSINQRIETCNQRIETYNERIETGNDYDLYYKCICAYNMDVKTYLQVRPL
jgi:hypothetical protein